MNAIGIFNFKGKQCHKVTSEFKLRFYALMQTISVLDFIQFQHEKRYMYSYIYKIYICMTD